MIMIVDELTSRVVSHCLLKIIYKVVETLINGFCFLDVIFLIINFSQFNERDSTSALFTVRLLVRVCRFANCLELSLLLIGLI